MDEHNKSNDRVKWDHVNKWIQREGLITKWKAYGMPEAQDPFSSRFVDVAPMPIWDIPPKIMISTAITGAFFSKRSNPNQPITPDEIRQSAEECILAGAPNIHIHVRDDSGYNVLDADRFRQVIEPLRKKYPEVTFDGCLVAVNQEESDAMAPTMDTMLFDALPVNTTALCCGDSMFFKAPHVVIGKAKLVESRGLKPLIAVYTDGDIDNARRFLIESGVVSKPYSWLVLPAMPGCSPMHNPKQMIEGLMRMVNSIRDIDPEAFIVVCAAGRASTYLATLAILMGLHVRIGMEDTVWPYPHKDEIITSNVEQFKRIKLIAELHGRELMTPSEYRVSQGMPSKSRYQELHNA
ncbi:MAG: 3-keto-5-aminohexanoate cleavage protein [Betaproteobacteria bacterium]|jgi:3-keto-5-aminohexanoate cleavage enzyme